MQYVARFLRSYYTGCFIVCWCAATIVWMSAYVFAIFILCPNCFRFLFFFFFEIPIHFIGWKTICKRNRHLNAKNETLFSHLTIWYDLSSASIKTHFCFVCIKWADMNFARKRKLATSLIIYSTHFKLVCVCVFWWHLTVSNRIPFNCVQLNTQTLSTQLTISHMYTKTTDKELEMVCRIVWKCVEFIVYPG